MATTKRFGKFRGDELLGRGGGGEVWKAWDEILERWVALKIPLGASEEDLARFRREAQLAGALNHPNIAAVFEIVEGEGLPLIAMQLVEGRTLRAAGKLPPKRAAKIVRDAARAVAFAHQQGVIHRDLKPENLMLGRGDHVYVMDFGLARTASSELSQSGTVMGTPSYMPPEQARGERVDARADVYSLGATLYAALSGRAPFEGTTVIEICRRVIEEDSAPLGLAPDLDAILECCLQKDREARYADAGALADDLDCFLAGKPVQARRSGALERLRRWSGRRRAILVAVLAALVLIAAALVVIVPRLRQATGDTAVVSEQLVSSMRETAEACLDAALDLRRAGRVPEMRAHAERGERACREVIARAPQLAEPHYLLGRIHRAMMRDDEALAEQQRAIALDPNDVRSRYERIVLTARAAERMKKELQAEAWRAEGRRASTEGAMQAPQVRGSVAIDDAPLRLLLAPMNGDIEALKGSTMDEGKRLCAEGLRAWLKRDASAAATLRRALAASPHLEEAHVALVHVEFTARRPAEGYEACAAGLQSDPGYLPLWLMRAELRSQEAEYLADPWPTFDVALADCEEAIRLDPGFREAYRVKASVLRERSWRERALDRDAEKSLRAAEAAADKMLELGAAADGFGQRGAVRIGLAEAMASRGLGSAERFEAAVGDYSRAVELEPTFPRWRRARAEVRIKFAEFLSVAGRAVLDAALADVEESLRLNPGDPSSWLARATVRLDLASLARRRGESVQPLCGAALEDFDRAVKLAPTSPDVERRRAGGLASVAELTGGSNQEALAAYDRAVALGPHDAELLLARGYARNTAAIRGAHEFFEAALKDFDAAGKAGGAEASVCNGRGTVLMNWGNQLVARGGTSDALYRRAFAEYEKVVALRPGGAAPLVQRAFARTAWAAALGIGDAEGLKLLTAALVDLEAALKRRPDNALAWMRKGMAHAAIARRAASGSAEARAAFTEAVAAYGRSIERQPGDPVVWMRRATARIDYAIGQFDGREGSIAVCREALLDLEKSVALNAADPEVWLHRGNANVTLADLGSERSDPEPFWAKALEDFRHALELNPLETQAHLSSAVAHFNRAQRATLQKRDPVPHYRESKTSAERALAINGRLAAAWRTKGDASVYLSMALYGKGEDVLELTLEAIAAFEQAVGIEPSLGPVVKRQMEAARGYVKWHGERKK